MAAILLLPTAPAQTGWSYVSQGPARAAFAYDSQRDRVVALSDGTFEYDGSTWTQLATAAMSPSPGLIAFDANRRRVVVCSGSTYEWDGGSWTAHAPGAAGMELLAYHAGLGRLLGLSRATQLSTSGLFQWTGSMWLPVGTGYAPGFSCGLHCTCYYRAMAYDASRDRLVLFGRSSSCGGGLGQPGISSLLPPETWEWDAAQGWVLQPGSSGAVDWSPNLVYDEARGVLCMLHPDYPGYPVATPVRLWRYAGSGQWTRMQGVDSPGNIQSPGAVYDRQRGRMLMLQAISGQLWSFVPPRASYETRASGCAGALGVPGLAIHQPSNLPWLGGTMTLTLTNLPVSLSFLLTGARELSPPLDLSPFGLAGCALYVAPTSLQMLFGGPSTAWQCAIPMQPRLLGAQFFQQALVPSPPSNSQGLVVSDLARGVIGL